MNAARRGPFRGPATTAGAALAVCALSVLCAPALAEAAGTTRKGDSLFRRIFSGPQSPTEISVSFRLLTDIDLPGPLPDGNPRLVDGRVVIPVAGGTAVTGWEPGSAAVVTEEPSSVAPPVAEARQDGDPEADAVDWSVDPSGRYRARFRDDGTLIMQRRCRLLCSGWDKIWKLRVPGSRHGAPLVTESRVYFGAMDNRVYSLQKRTGDRVWASDIGERPSRPVRLWEGDAVVAGGGAAASAPTTERQRLILVAPEAGSRLLALDRRTGKVAASFQLEDADGTLKGYPVTTPDGKILVAREKYRPDQASLMVFELISQLPARRAPNAADDDLEEPQPDAPAATGGAREKKDSP